MRLLLPGAVLAAVGLGLVYVSLPSSNADASRFWVNSVTVETAQPN